MKIRIRTSRKNGGNALGLPGPLEPVRDPRVQNAFALADLLVLVGMMALLMTLFGSGRAKAAGGSPASVCLENLRRLSFAWHLYTSDHGGQLVNNLFIPDTLAVINSKRYSTWANNVMDWATSPMNTNRELAAVGQLGAYIGNDPDVFHCPSDTFVSPMQRQAGWSQRSRTYSMNASMGSPFQRILAGSSTATGINEWCRERRQLLSLATISNPSELYVFLEEHPDSINDGLYLLNCGSAETWGDQPASFHEGACGFAFADGHTELHPWIHDETKRPVRFSFRATVIPSTARDDFQWVLDRTSVAPSQLTVSKSSGNQLQITWSQVPPKPIMQATEQLSSGTWTNAGVSLERSVGQNAVRVPMEGGQRFFRLSE